MTDPHVSIHIRSYGHEGHQHSHDYHQLVLPLAGTLSLSMAHLEDEVAHQRAAIIPAGERHGYYARDENRFLVADVPDHQAPALVSLPRFVDLSPPLQHYVRFLDAQLRHGSMSGCTGQQVLQLLVQLLQEQYGAAVQPDRRIQVARRFLDEHYRRRVTVAELARVAHLSPRQLNHLFRQQVGLPPHQYLLQRRMHEARRLLEHTRLGIRQVAEAVGYSSLAAFSDRFSRYFGLAPSHFRRNPKNHHMPAKTFRPDDR